MKLTENIGLIEYTKPQEALNCLTHFAGAVFGLAGLCLCLEKVRGEGPRFVLSAAVLHGLVLRAFRGDYKAVFL